MRWKNSTHRCPRCGVLQSHLMLWCSCITIVFPKTATLHLAAIGGSLNAPHHPARSSSGLFCCLATTCGGVCGGSVNADRRCTRPPKQKLRHQRSGFQFQPLVAKLPLASLDRHHPRRTRSRRWHSSSSRPLPCLWRTYISLLCSCLVHR